MTRTELLNGLYKKYNLTKKDDIFKSENYSIIKRCGIEKIQKQAKIEIKYDIVYADHDSVIVKATGKLLQSNDPPIETFGEASPLNYRQLGAEPYYPAAMAEKRAMSRVILKLAGFYELEVFGEDELTPTQKSTPATKGSKALAGTIRKATPKV